MSGRKESQHPPNRLEMPSPKKEKAAPSGNESRPQELGAATMKTPSKLILPLHCLMCGKNLSQASKMPRKGGELLCETCAHTPFSSAHDLPWHCVLCGKALELHNDNSLVARMSPSHDLLPMCGSCVEKTQPDGHVCTLSNFVMALTFHYKIRKTHWGERFMPSSQRTLLRRERARIRLLNFGKEASAEQT